MPRDPEYERQLLQPIDSVSEWCDRLLTMILLEQPNPHMPLRATFDAIDEIGGHASSVWKDYWIEHGDRLKLAFSRQTLALQDGRVSHEADTSFDSYSTNGAGSSHPDMASVQPAPAKSLSRQSQMQSTSPYRNGEACCSQPAGKRRRVSLSIESELMPREEIFFLEFVTRTFQYALPPSEEEVCRQLEHERPLRKSSSWLNYWRHSSRPAAEQARALLQRATATTTASDTPHSPVASLRGLFSEEGPVALGKRKRRPTQKVVLNSAPHGGAFSPSDVGSEDLAHSEDNSAQHIDMHAMQLHDSSRKHRRISSRPFTAEDADYLVKFVRDALIISPDASQMGICRLLEKQRPDHSAQRWRYFWRSTGPEEARRLIRDAAQHNERLKTFDYGIMAAKDQTPSQKSEIFEDSQNEDTSELSASVDRKLSPQCHEDDEDEAAQVSLLVNDGAEGGQALAQTKEPLCAASIKSEASSVCATRKDGLDAIRDLRTKAFARRSPQA